MIGNMLNTLINAQRVGKKRVAVPFSGYKKELLQFLQQKEVVSAVRVQEGPMQKLIVTLKYDEADQPRIRGLRRLSKPGQKVYVGASKLPFAEHGTGFYVLSTSQGLMDEVKARKEGLGGELVCEIW